MDSSSVAAGLRSRRLDPEGVELRALRGVLAAIRDGLSLEGAARECLDRLLDEFDLPLGCLYVRRHDYLLPLVSRGWPLPAPPIGLLPLDEGAWYADAGALGAGTPAEGLPPALSAGAVLVLPLRIQGQWIGLLLLGGVARPGELPPIYAAARAAEHLAVAIDNAERLERVRSVLNDTRDVIFRTDAAGRWTYLNQAWEETMGQPIALALGRRVSSYVPADRRADLGYGLDLLVARGAVIGRRTLPFELADGQVRHFDVQTRLLRDDRQQTIGAAGVLRDVSLPVRQARELARANAELRRRAEALEQANTELAEADRLKSEFLAGVSHELRTPLGLVRGYTELLQDGVGGEPSPVQREYLDFIDEAAGRLERLILHLLELTGLEAGRTTVTPEPIDLGPPVAAALARLATPAAARGVTMAEPRGAERLVLAEPARLERVLELLLDNALKFNVPGGRIELVVTVQPTVEPFAGTSPGKARFARVAVSDTGQGVPVERQPYLFRKFVQGDGSDTRLHGGLGLGLPLARALVERLGGRIELRSEGVGRGACVAFTLPLVRPEGD